MNVSIIFQDYHFKYIFYLFENLAKYTEFHDKTTKKLQMLNLFYFNCRYSNNFLKTIPVYKLINNVIKAEVFFVSYLESLNFFGIQLNFTCSYSAVTAIFVCYCFPMYSAWILLH